MLTYTYACKNKKCDIHKILFEVKQNIKDDVIIICPDCNKNTLKRVITNSGGFRIGGHGVNKPTAYWGDPK